MSASTSSGPPRRNGEIERASFAVERTTPVLETKGLSPFVLAVLQALDPREIGLGEDSSRRRGDE